MAKTSFMSDPEFQNWFLRRHSVHELNALFEQYLKETNSIETFESWFNRLPLMPELMNLIHNIYVLDQKGKKDRESLVINLQVTKPIPIKPKLPPITKEDIDRFSDFVANGGLDDYLNKKKNQ